MELFELIQTLNTAHGPSGDEGAVREVIAALARPHADEVTADTLGNLIVRKRGSGPKVMLCAHMDSTGLIVTHIEKEGFLRVGTLGGIAARELLYTPVRFKNGVRGVMSYSFIYIPWFCYLEKAVTRNYHVMHVALDDFIPFNEYFIVPYMMWFLYVAGTIVFFLFRNKEDYYRICTFLFSGMTISLIICTFFHNGTDFRPAIDPGKNIFSGMVAALYQTDTPTNVFPSIHVYNSIGTHIAIMKSESFKKYPWVRAGSAILMVSICLSTVFLKQHSVIDMVGAAIMAYVIYGIVYGYNWSAEDKKVTQKALS